MKTKTKISAYILRSSAAALLFSCMIVALSSAINLPNHPPKLPAPQNNTAFGANGPESASSVAASAIQRDRTLTFADRVAYQRAIEEVYWQHRIWPAANVGPKPPLDKVMSQAEIEKKVEDYLRNSQALEDYWQRPITPDQLQAEMERIASHTKQPGVLREIFAALGNDPFVIAESLARPVLANRLITELYAHDQRFHGELKGRAEAQLRTHRSVSQVKETSGMYSEMEWIKSDSGEDTNKGGSAPNTFGDDGKANRERGGAEHGITLKGSEWQESVNKLAKEFGNTKGSDAWAQIKTGVLSPLQEDDEHYYAVAVTKKGKDRLKLATVAWLKEPLKSWLARAEKQIPVTMAAGMGIEYALPAIAEPATTCTDNTWATTATDVPTPRFGHTAVWTGSEMIVWGGCDDVVCYSNTGGRYDPATDNWRGTSTTSAPDGRTSHTAVWTGSEMIVWGGFDGGNDLNTGGRYNPITDTWAATSTTNAPSARNAHTAVWTGGEMITWGGFDRSFNDLNTGGRYDPSTDSWIATSINNAPSARDSHTAVWTGSQMIVWGGRTNTGGRYNPSTNSWAATSTTNAPAARYDHTAVWTGSQMIVWGGCNGSLPCANPFNTGGRYNPITDTWTATSINNAPYARGSQTAVWTGSEMIVWGGFNDAFLNTGGRYNPSADTWTATSTTNAPSGRNYHTAVWTGSEMIIWGGSGGGAYLNTGRRYNPTTNSWTATATLSDTPGYTAVWTGSEMIVWGGTVSDVGVSKRGARYNPSTDSWSGTSITNAPAGRENHTAVWTGDEMIIWGGFNGNNDLNTGGKYNPGTDSWTATSINNAPDARTGHTAVWTGSEMIVWGGGNRNGAFNTGGRYNPSSDSWIATSINNAPDARAGHTAVWTGSEMIVWGGFLNTGGRYNPGTDSWTATSTNNAPSARGSSTAVWTGSEMIVWGGFDGGSLNTGGRYNPSADTWTATSTTNAPSVRDSHTAVWTGGEMLVWGGEYFDGSFSSPLNTGGRYNPISDSWIATTTTNAPTARELHTAVWIGSEMIIWGGDNTYDMSFNTGGRYCAHLPTPTPTPTPGVTTNPATNGASFSATLNGSLNPRGSTTTVYFQYGLTTSYGSNTAMQTQTGNTVRAISANISGLAASTTHHFRIVAHNAGGTVYGSDRTFTTLSPIGPPVAITNPASYIASFSARPNGSVDPHGLATTVYFQYGTTAAYGLTTAPQSKAGNTYQSVTANIGSLTARTTYHFRIVATNSSGTRYGSDRTFTTLNGTGPPVAITNPATNVASSSATLNGSVDPHGLSTSVHFQYGTTTSYGRTTANQTKTGNTYQNVAANISGLTTHTTYHFRIVTTNSAGTRFGSDRTFTTTP